MTKTELANKILSYDPKARIDIWWDGGVSNMPLEALQSLVREWQEMNIPKPPKNFCKACLGPTTSIFCSFECQLRYQGSESLRLKPKNIPEPDPTVLPDYNS